MCMYARVWCYSVYVCVCDEYCPGVSDVVCSILWSICMYVCLFVLHFSCYELVRDIIECPISNPKYPLFCDGLMCGRNYSSHVGVV